MKLTQRGRLVLFALSIATGALLGFTAELWNPIARELSETK